MYSWVGENYDHAKFQDWGVKAEESRDKLIDGIYISKLCDKVEHLFGTEKNKQTAKDRLYFKAIIQYLKELHKEVESVVGGPSRYRYVMTYPSYWNPEQVAYLRSLVQMAGIIDEQDHHDRLMMYNEGESALRALQLPVYEGIIKQGCTYMICNIGGSKVKMSLFDIKEPLDSRNNIKGASLREWDVNYMNQSPQLSIGLQNIFKQHELYILSRLSIPVRMCNIDDDKYQDGFLVDPGKVSSGGEYLGYGKSFDQKEYLGPERDSGGLEDVTRRKALRDIFRNSVTDVIFSYLDYYDDDASDFPGIFLEPSEQMLKHNNDADPKLQHRSLEDTIPTESSTIPVVMPYLQITTAEVEKYVLKPACDEIIFYLKSILQGTVGDSVEAIVLTGDFFRVPYLLELIKNTCNAAGVKVIFFKENRLNIYYSPSTVAILSGAMYKAMDKFLPRSDTFKVLLDKKESIESISPELFVFMDYGLKKTRVSYIITQPGQAPNHANIDHVMDWPGQSASDPSFPTVDVMLIPGSKKIISLKENSDHIYNLTTTQKVAIYNTYYTFHKEKRSILMFTHIRRDSQKKPTHIDVDDLRFSENGLLRKCADRETLTSTSVDKTSNGLSKINDNFNFTVTQKRISFQEFSMMYFEYLTSYLYEYFRSKIGTEYSQCRFCVTRDSLEEPDGFILSDEDLRSIANKCGMLSADARHCHNKMLALEHAQATTIFCREKIKNLNKDNRATHLHILQVQLTENRCTLLLNRFPFLREGVNVHNMPEGEEWSGLYKYEESKRIPFNAMDIICDNLWIHLQTHQHIVLKRCERHQLPHRIFNSDNMHIFKNLLLDYLYTADLDLMDGVKVNEICICKSGHEENCCRVYISNEGLLEFCVIPVIDKLASTIVCHYSNMHLRQKLKISSIFVMGVFLFCRSQRDYNVLEDLLLAKLEKIKSLYLVDFELHSMINTVQITKLDDQNSGEQIKYSNIVDADDNNEQDQESLTRIRITGSVVYGTNPRNRLFVRSASRTYAIVLTVPPPDSKLTVYTPCKTSRVPIVVTSDMKIPIIEKDSYLTSVGGDIDTYFTVVGSLKRFAIHITFHILDEDPLIHSNLNNDLQQPESSLAPIVYEYSSAYPIVVKARPSLTQPYKFWVEYGLNQSTRPIYIQEGIMLKSNYDQHQI
ncbi:unnamed protein product [Mucor hiemalis]